MFEVPDDLRLVDEVGEYKSVEGSLLFLYRWTIPRDIIFDLFCLKVEIEDEQSNITDAKNEGSTTSPRAQHDLSCRLGWLHTMRKEKLESVTCRTNECLRLVSDRFALQLDWYK